MARISKQEYPRILHMVDGEHRKVAEVAAEYGCTAANIYALLGKMRRAAPADTEPVGATKAPADTSSLPAPQRPFPSHALGPAVVVAGSDLFAAAHAADADPVREASAGQQLDQPADAC